MASVRQMLGTPTKTSTYPNGIVLESYESPQMDITYRNGQTIEIRESDSKYTTPDGISLNNTFSQIGKIYTSLQRTKFVDDEAKNTGCDFYYYHDSPRGITFSIMAENDVGVLPSLKPDAIIVSQPNQKPLDLGDGTREYPDDETIQKNEFGYR